METPVKKPVKAGYRYGLVLFIVGLILVIINAAMIYCAHKYFPKLTLTGLTIVILSPVFFIFPGGSLEKMPETRDMGKMLFRHAPLLHKISWIVWGIGAIAAAFYIVIYFDPGFLHLRS